MGGINPHPSRLPRREPAPGGCIP